MRGQKIDERRWAKVRPKITEGQRAVAVALLANAIRKDERQQDRREERSGDLALAGGARRRAEASAQYVRGMRDLLAVLFNGGRSVADACYEEAQSLAHGGKTADDEPPAGS
jgi:hypothetical protein